MKKYNKPVVEINGFEVEDIMAESTDTGHMDDAAKAAFQDYLANGGSAPDSGRVLIFEW